MGYCEFGNTPFILSQNIKLIYNSLINDNILLSHDKKIHLTSNVIMAYADMLDIVQFVLTSRVVYCLFLYKFLP